MGYKIKLLLALLFCLITFPAAAKVNFLDIPVDYSHIQVVKGQLYVSSQSPTESDRNKALYAQAIDWLEKLHNKKETFEISKIEKEESTVIQASIYFISNVARGTYKPKLSGRNIEIWYTIGQKVFVYKKGKAWRLEIK